MRYTVLGLQQSKLIEYDLDLIDALLIDTLMKMYSTNGFEYIVENNKKYIWINQTYLTEYLPIIGTKKTMQRRIKRLEDKGVIERKVKHRKNGIKGNFSYIAFTKKHKSLTEFEGYLSSGVRVTSQMGQGLPHQRGNKDTTNRDTTNKDTKHLIFFEDVWKKYPSKKGKGKVSNTKKKEIYKLGDEFKRCIDRYKKYVEGERAKGFKELKYQNGSTFFNSGYIDYLDENYKEDKKDERVGVPESESILGEREEEWTPWD